tara:strand:+ start:438 stop:1469 length:1032 start_codon:yes stop_codon:yes gene_type:complete
MAVPKVFISSTCFDLSEVREQLSRFISNYGFEPVLSEHGDVFYHPDLHTHEACVHEVTNCQLFILIVGGRFGGEYISDRSKSITNAEYDAAKKHDIPVFTYVRSEVLSNHHIYQENKNKPFAADIDYPAIDKQKYAVDIFNFIDQVRRSPINNALEGFENFSDIESSIRKQWAGMFFDFLKTREVKSQIDATNHSLAVLNSSSSKLESLVKSLYRSLDQENADNSITAIEIENTTLNFYKKVLSHPHDDEDSECWLDNEIDISSLAKVSPEGKTWDEYLIALGLFEPGSYEENGDLESSIDRIGFGYGYILSPDFHKDELNWFTNGVLNTTEEQRYKALKTLV